MTEIKRPDMIIQLDDNFLNEYLWQCNLINDPQKESYHNNDWLLSDIWRIIDSYRFWFEQEPTIVTLSVPCGSVRDNVDIRRFDAFCGYEDGSDITLSINTINFKVSGYYPLRLLDLNFWSIISIVNPDPMKRVLVQYHPTHVRDSRDAPYDVIWDKAGSYEFTTREQARQFLACKPKHPQDIIYVSHGRLYHATYYVILNEV